MNDSELEENKNLAFEMWKFHTNIGGNDKNWMIQIDSWLLAISAGILSFSVTRHDVDLSSQWVLPIAGIAISFLGVLVAILYGGYAAAHWKIADSIANEYGLEKQKPKNWPFGEKDCAKDTVDRMTSENKVVRWVNCLARCLSMPCEGKVAPVFWIYLIVSAGFALAHGFVLVYRLVFLTD